MVATIRSGGGGRIGAIVLILLVGAALRAGFFYLHTGEQDPGEAFRAAATLARTGTLGNPFFGDSGPSAHLLPLPILLGAAVYTLLGVGTLPAELVLSLISVGFAFLGFLLSFAAFRRAGAPAAAGLLGLALCCMLPLNLGLETVTFRLWEGGMAMAIAAGLLFALVSLDTADTPPSWRATIALGFVAALLFFVSPQLGVAGYASAALLLIRRVPARRWAGTLAIATTALALVLAPWLIRNDRVMGAPMLRSNLGLELAIGFHADAVNPPDLRQAYIDRMLAIHPLATRHGFDTMMAAGGEVAYSRRLGEETRAWIGAHPAAAARIGVRHLGQYLFPPRWSFLGNAAGTDTATGFKAVATWLLAALGLLGLGRRLILDRRGPFDYVAVMVVVTSGLFVLVQPILRYRYLIHAPMVFYAADLLVAMLGGWSPTRASVHRIERWWMRSGAAA